MSTLYTHAVNGNDNMDWYPTGRANHEFGGITKELTPTISTKRAIPPDIKVAVWNRYIGERVFTSQCSYCRVATITKDTFKCKRIIPISKGGTTTVDNMIPVCITCCERINARDISGLVGNNPPPFTH